MGKVDDNKQQKQERLLDTAFELFTTKGIAKTSISDIVNNAGVAKGTFYLYFRDKYDIANRLIAHRANILCVHALEQLAKNDLTKPEDRLIFVVDSILSEFQKRHVVLRFINKNLSWGIFKHAIEQPSFGLEQFLSAIFEDSLNEWNDLETMLFLIIEMVSGSCYSVILDHDPMPLDEFKPHLYLSIRALMAAFHADADQT